jgi:hypothetical protein
VLHPFLIALWIVARIAVVAMLIWGAYSLAQIHNTLQQLKKPQVVNTKYRLR